MSHRFQINLSALIDLLSQHLYSSADVFVRELLQNAADAIAARQQREPDHAGHIRIELDQDMCQLRIHDNGIGMSDVEMHRFLAIIGESSKRNPNPGQVADFLGQFGIGLLACFTVADEIVLHSRSAKNGNEGSFCWRGRSDGSYTIEVGAAMAQAGTQVVLQVRAEFTHLLKLSSLERALRHYGDLLPVPITLHYLQHEIMVNQRNDYQCYPWDASHLPAEQQKDFQLQYGRQHLQEEIFDVVPLHSAAGQVEGLACIMAHSVSVTALNQHRVYIKRMLLSDDVQNLLPDWAVFVRCIVNCRALQPTAARNAFYRNQQLAQTQQELGDCLKNYLR